jgi:CHAT domain-containing protein
LLLLPFEALVVNRAGSSDFSHLDYLIRYTSVVYNFNSGLLGKEESTMDISKARLLALGADDPDTSVQILPGARKELDEIKQFMTGEFIYSATKADLLERLDTYDIIHVALHGQADLYNFYGSHLRFIGDGPTESELHPYELFDRQVSADLVVLSACESGLGKSVAGEGIMGMGRAFKYAGASSIIQSVWRADDDATQKIMSLFYSAIRQKNVGYEEALYQAKLSLLESGDNKTAHPGRWAAMLHYGDTGAALSLWDTLWAKTFLAIIALMASIFLLSRKLSRSGTRPHL